MRSAKHHLPNYGVFDEYRIFVRGDRLPVVRVHGVDVATVVCEDLWQDGGPVSVTRSSGAGLLLALNASPYERDKDDVRLELCARRAREAGCALAYVNLVGGQDELVFDGDSVVVGADGTLLARAPRFVEHLLVTDLALPAAGPAPADRVQVDAGTAQRSRSSGTSRPPIRCPPTRSSRRPSPSRWKTSPRCTPRSSSGPATT